MKNININGIVHHFHIKELVAFEFCMYVWYGGESFLSACKVSFFSLADNNNNDNDSNLFP